MIDRIARVGKEEKMADEKKLGREERYALLEEKSKKMRKNVIRVGAILLGVIVLLVAVTLIADFLTKPRVNTDIPDGTFDFYPPYDGDILTSEEYLQLNRTVMYFDNAMGYGMGLEINPETMEEFDAPVWFLYEYIQTIVQGNATLYNTYFSDAYYRTQKPKASFAQQMIYETSIYFRSESVAQNGDKLITYRLEYKIHRNNGEFRTDVGSDGIRPQDLTLRVSPDGRILIESLVTVFKN